jgi:hypothetical protein
MAVSELERYLDATGRVRVYPSKNVRKRLVLAYLAFQFRPGQEYSEAEVNALLRGHHTFDDPALLRRDLFDWGFLDRTADGARYWLIPQADESPTGPPGPVGEDS